MSQKPQPAFGLNNNEDFAFLDHYVDPSWATIDSTTGGVDENIFAGLPDFAKEPLFLEPLPFDLGSFVTPMSTENPSISTKDIFSPVAPQPLAGSSAQGASAGNNNGFELSLSAFSDSASPADSHSPSQSASAHADEAHTESDEDSDDQDAEDDFMSRKRSSSGRGRGPSASVKSKRAANKPKPYPRVSDVVRDAPHRLAAEGKRQPATTELKGSVRTGDAADDDWRPTMEEYQKMSSKEKRQLRNKISARNFRVRRKGKVLVPESDISSNPLF